MGIFQSNGFKERTEKGKIAISKFIEKLETKNISYAHTGYEDWVATSEFYDQIKNIHTHSSNRIRFFPDLSIIYKGETFLIEIKNSSGIEKECYETYLDLEKIGYKINIAFYLQESFFCFSRPSSLPFNKISKTIKGIDISEYISECEKFILMQKMKIENKQKFYELKKVFKNSGNDFGYVDKNKMKKFIDTY
jgi:hypothetical protein